tara:strand:+ start:42 stop:164 length:123 start_codon:yes stop_codon:yes gene_type:complete
VDEDIKKFLIKCGIAFLFLLALALIILGVIDANKYRPTAF